MIYTPTTTWSVDKYHSCPKITRNYCHLLQTTRARASLLLLQVWVINRKRAISLIPVQSQREGEKKPSPQSNTCFGYPPTIHKLSSILQFTEIRRKKSKTNPWLWLLIQCASPIHMKRHVLNESFILLALHVIWLPVNMHVICGGMYTMQHRFETGLYFSCWLSVLVQVANTNEHENIVILCWSKIVFFYVSVL